VPELPHTPATHNTPYRAGKGYVYEGGLRVPLIVRWPGRIKPGVVEAPVLLTDLPLTLAELAGVKLPGAADGVSLVSLWTGRGLLPERVLTWHFPHYTNQGGRPAGAIRSGDWKLIEHYEDGRLELFHLGRDPRESIDLAAKEPDRAKALQAQLAAWRKSIGAQQNRPNPAYDAELAKPIYHSTDTSRITPAATAAETAEPLRGWRAAMDAAVRRAQPAKQSAP